VTAKSVTVYHPTHDGVSQDVPAAAVDGWVEQGWRKSKPKSRNEAPAVDKAAQKVLDAADVPTPIITAP